MLDKCRRVTRRDGFEVPRIELVDDHANERVRPTAQPTETLLKIAYIGNMDNTFIPAEIAPAMLEFSAQAQSDFERTSSEIHSAHMHYCVRREISRRQPKPFTKGGYSGEGQSQPDLYASRS